MHKISIIFIKTNDVIIIIEMKNDADIMGKKLSKVKKYISV